MRNKFEKKIYQQLKRAKVSFKYESERIPYVLSGHYIPDFVLQGKSGKIFFETKGYLRPESKRKLLAVKKCHPAMDIRLIFYENRKSNNRWAIKNGFKFAICNIPKEWLNE